MPSAHDAFLALQALPHSGKLLQHHLLFGFSLRRHHTATYLWATLWPQR